MLGRPWRRTGAHRLTPASALAALALAAALLAACGEKEENLDAGATTTANEPAAAIAGSWTGELTQKGLAPFQVAVVILPDGTGRVAYTGINCGGTWTPRFTAAPAAGARYLFEERTDRGAGGKCKGSGTVSLTPAGGTLSYRFVGGGISSNGVLSPAGADQMSAVFKQAGLKVDLGGQATVTDEPPPG